MVFAPLIVMGKLAVPVLLMADGEGDPIPTVGAVLSTVTDELGPTAAEELPAVSLAMPAAIEIVYEPLPASPLTRTVGVAVEPLRIVTEPPVAPVRLIVTLPLTRLTVLAPETVIGKS